MSSTERNDQGIQFCKRKHDQWLKKQHRFYTDYVHTKSLSRPRSRGCLLRANHTNLRSITIMVATPYTKPSFPPYFLQSIGIVSSVLLLPSSPPSHGFSSMIIYIFFYARVNDYFVSILILINNSIVDWCRLVISEGGMTHSIGGQ